MKVISIGSDRKMFEEGSAVLLRTLEYAKRVEEMHVIVFTTKKEGHKEKHFGNLYLYPTNSLTQWTYVHSGWRVAQNIANKIKGNVAVSTQDPFLTGLVGRKIKKNFYFPLQVQIHTDFLSSYFSGLRNFVRKHMARKVLKSADRVRVVSSVIEESLLKKFPGLEGKIDMLPVFVDIERITNQTPTKDIKNDFPQWKFHVFMGSRLTKEKRFDTALKAFAKVVKEYPHAGLVIAGSGEEKGAIESLAHKLHIQNNIALIGWQNDLISYMKTSNVFLLTSEYEGYGMTLVEAAASGALIVTTKVGLAKTSLFQDEKNCHICPVGDYECLGTCMIEILRDNSARELFGRRAQEDAQKSALSKDTYSAAYVGLLEKLLQK